jgi:protocatechuate 3,4-dioxygenase, beta subunit
MIRCGGMLRGSAAYHISILDLHEGGVAMIPRRRMLEVLAGGAAGYSLWCKVRAAMLAPTPPQTAGPFYPLSFPPDADNDLVQITGRAGTAKGTVTHVSGRVFDESGRAVSGARVEIWQCDANGRYHYANDGRSDPPRDENFQGYGQTLTDEEGGYRFRTIRPVPYPGRTPHIHFAVSGSGRPRFVTQMYVAGELGNDRDGILMGVRDPAARARLIVTLRPAAEAEANALAGTFDIVLG